MAKSGVKSVKKVIATVLVVLLVLLVLYALKPLAPALIGSAVLYVMFEPLYAWFNRKGLSDKVSATLVIITSLLIVIIPLALIVTLSVGQVTTVVNMVQENGAFATFQTQVEAFDVSSLNIKGPIQNFAQRAARYAQQVLLSAAGAATNAIIGMFVMYFTLFYLLTNKSGVGRYAQEVIPFNRKNRRKLMTEFSRITKATVYTTGAIALMEGIILAVLLWVLGVPSPLFFGLVGGVVSFIPVLGTFVVWVPAAIIYAVLGNFFVAGALVLGGIFMATIDNVVRPGLNKRFGEIHPLVSVLGVFAGLPLFGMIGILLGPLLLSYFLMIIRMFEAEYF